MTYRFILFALVLGFGGFAFSASAEDEVCRFTTLNCYWFFGNERSKAADEKKPQSPADYDRKAGHLVGLLPDRPPLFVGLQEIGDANDVQRLAHAAQARYKHSYQPIFIQGKDHTTKQDVGALLDISVGWGIYGKASRVSELDKVLSKHLVVRLTNAVTHVDVCVVHLRVPMGNGSNEKQQDQVRALLRWSMRHLSKAPTANLVIMGDFNEHKRPNDPAQALYALLSEARPPLVDAIGYNIRSSEGMKTSTHATMNKALDRIIVSDAILKGSARLKLSSVSIGRHGYGRKQATLYTDHFPVTVELLLTP